MLPKPISLLLEVTTLLKSVSITKLLAIQTNIPLVEPPSFPSRLQVPTLKPAFPISRLPVHTLNNLRRFTPNLRLILVHLRTLKLKVGQVLIPKFNIFFLDFFSILTCYVLRAYEIGSFPSPPLRMTSSVLFFESSLNSQIN